MKATPSSFPLALLALLATACPPAERGVPVDVASAERVLEIVDLTHPFDAKTIYWPTEDGFELTESAKGMQPGGYYYEANVFRAAEHGGTHVDAPVHFAKGKWTVDQIPLENLIGDAILVDVSANAEGQPDYAVTVEDFVRWETIHGPIPDGRIVLVHTGWGERWPKRKRYLGTDERGEEALAKLRFPGLSPEAAHWLVDDRNVHAVGLDTPSIDPGRSTTFEAHQILFAANVPAFENLARLDRLPPTGFDVVALPMKIRGGSGAPLRIVALIEK